MTRNLSLIIPTPPSPTHQPLRVLFLTMFPAIGASSRYRVYQYLPHLERQGVSCTVSPLLSERYFRVSMGLEKMPTFRRLLFSSWAMLCALTRRCADILGAGRYDLVFIQKDILPWAFAALLKRINPNILYDVDDVIYLAHPNARGLTRWLMERRRSFFNNMPKISRAVFVENQFIEDHVRRLCPRVIRLTGPIDTERFSPAQRPAAENHEKILIGWIGAPSTAYNLKVCRAAMRRISDKHPQVSLLLVGCPAPDLPGVRLRCEPWRLDTEVGLLQEMDIGIMPLVDEEWNRGKGGTKLLQYMACGLPCVASPIEINREIVQDGETGLLASSEEDWFVALEKLVLDAELRRRLGRQGRKRALEQYSLAKAVDLWLALFREIATAGRT